MTLFFSKIKNRKENVGCRRKSHRNNSLGGVGIKRTFDKKIYFPSYPKGVAPLLSPAPLLPPLPPCHLNKQNQNQEIFLFYNQVGERILKFREVGREEVLLLREIKLSQNVKLPLLSYFFSGEVAAIQ